MNNKVAQVRSSCIVTIPLLACNFCVCLVCAFFKLNILAALFMLLFLTGLIARAWAAFALKKLHIKLDCPKAGLFPGNELPVTVTVENKKILPVVWIRIFAPLQYNRCMEPAETRPAETGEEMILEEIGADTEVVCEKMLPPLLWYEKHTDKFVWKAMRRGVYTFGNWRLITGDGFGLVQTEKPFREAKNYNIAVYPSLQKVSADIFLRSHWNAENGRAGVIEDMTLVRSVRDYLRSDPARVINWRLRARGLPLSSNVYEHILPGTIHFIFDGESFSGPEKHLGEMEDMLSVLASVIAALAGAHIDCGLSLPDAKGGRRLSLFKADCTELLYQLAAYDPLPDKIDEGSNTVVAQLSRFDLGALVLQESQVGRFYYLCRDIQAFEASGLSAYFDNSALSVITYLSGEAESLYDVIPVSKLKEGDALAV